MGIILVPWGTWVALLVGSTAVDSGSAGEYRGGLVLLEGDGGINRCTNNHLGLQQ